MQRLWAPWRMTYIEGNKSDTCVFCAAGNAARQGQDDDHLVLAVGDAVFALLNRYPYSSGHVMIVPFDHLSDLTLLPEAASAELWRMASAWAGLLQQQLHTDGLNVGMNLGAAAGAGIADHLHLHVVPRWMGDANFMTAIGDTKVLPEVLTDTAAKLRQAWAAARQVR